ncbi:zinc finger protein zat9 [Phtheirospermum japonicum]|uniref:Zinc finger protein zat9 n=1 Tax=Phtheirospermum japonicum TaxID=374723 RepID=A0A830BIU6_9LAMI|nr:zinc finger protein zat9 [Phtheirospermum japonicum]
MRSHVVSNSAESAEKFILEKKISSLSEFANGQTSYGLRENPRKTWRANDANSPLPLEKICKQCGKGFQSLKALCGHMACHSDKDKGLRDDPSWSTSENQKLVVDSHSDTEAEDRALRNRSSSKIKKIKKIVFLNNNNNNGSSSVSEIDGEEQEEVAMCLMLLSRDFGNNNSVVESSDNNSVILETKSSSIDMRVGKTNGPGEKNVSKAVIIALAENSDSGYFLDECAKAESDVSVDGYRKNGASFSRYNINNNKELTLASDPSRIEPRKRRPVSENPEPVGVSEKRSKYECFNCKKTFKSYQALGGHRPCHKRTNAFYESRYESGENSLDESTEFVARGKISGPGSNKKSSAANKTNKGHICPFCNRVFKNGQALGGHKRSHFIGGHDDYNNINNNRGPEKKKPDLLDLNLPAPQEDGEDDGNERFLADF